MGKSFIFDTPSKELFPVDDNLNREPRSYN